VPHQVLLCFGGPHSVSPGGRVPRLYQTVWKKKNFFQNITKMKAKKQKCIKQECQRMTGETTVVLKKKLQEAIVLD
jgi:hypothetical protein